MALSRKSSLVLKFETGAATHVGKVRRANEDSYVVRPEIGLWAVADGVGGHEGGQLASQTVAGDVASIGAAVSATDQLARFKDRVLRANDRIKQVAADRGGATIGTTVAAVLAFGHSYTCVLGRRQPSLSHPRRFHHPAHARPHRGPGTRRQRSALARAGQELAAA